MTGVQTCALPISYQTLQRVFNEQYKVDEHKVVVARKKEEISAKSIQSSHDTDCHSRNKGDQKVKGYSINVTESCDDDKPLNLIGHVYVRKASTSDVDFDDYRKEQAVWLDGIMKSRLYKSSPFKVVFMHMSLFHSDQWHRTLHCREVFTPLFEKYNVDLVIAGHTHRYGIHPANKDHSYPIVIGGGPNEGERTLIVMKATQKILNIDMLNDSGISVGRLEIKNASN